jgi:mycothiol system anti-sigma-R factor
MSAENSGDHHDDKCAEALTAMYLFLDKEQLTSDERQHVQEHLDDCIPCLESFEFEAEFQQVIRKKCKDEPPSALYEKIRVAISTEIIQKNPKPENPQA